LRFPSNNLDILRTAMMAPPFATKESTNHESLRYLKLLASCEVKDMQMMIGVKSISGFRSEHAAWLRMALQSEFHLLRALFSATTTPWTISAIDFAKSGGTAFPTC